MALTREGMKEERAGNTVGKKEREEKEEKKESNSINLCMDRWIFFLSTFLFHGGMSIAL